MTPNKDQFIELAKSANVIPVYAELYADMQTPVCAFAKLLDARDCFLLESAENSDKWGRYSFIGRGAHAKFTISEGRGELRFKSGKKIFSSDGESPFNPMRSYLKSRKLAHIDGLPSFVGGAVGYIGYECVSFFERLPEPKGSSAVPDASLAFFDEIVIFDNARHTAKILACAHVDEFDSPEAAYEYARSKVRSLAEIFSYSGRSEFSLGSSDKKIELKANMTKSEYENMVRAGKKYISEGDIIQVVLSQKFSAEADINPLSAYRALRLINPSPYMFCVKSGDSCLVGSSPETMLRFSPSRAELRPIAGTRRRGNGDAEDAALCDDLLSNEKERAEHLMLVDLGRNDLSRFCRAGSVSVSDFMTVEKYSHVMHLVSTVRGIPEEGTDAFDALAAAFPAGTLSGAPKIRAMEIINELEPERRGAYGGAVGYFGYGGDMDLAITIRTLQINKGRLTVQAGAGIVYDSDPEFEYEETRMKVRAVTEAIERAASLENFDPSSL